MFVKLRAPSELHKLITQQLWIPHILTHNRDNEITVHRCYSVKYSVYSDEKYNSDQDRAYVSYKYRP